MITLTLQTTTNEGEFKKQLMEQGIDIMVRRNQAEHIYGITFIDHHSKTVWNGSRLGKELSANRFNEHWNNSIKAPGNETVKLQPNRSKSNDTTLPAEAPHLFDFMNTFEKQESDFMGALAGLLPEAQGEDYEEIDFANRMKKKRKRQHRSK